MPVYNEAKYLRKTIASVLSQTHRDFVFLISDNHSTDGSAEIIEEACRQDSRIQKTSPPVHMPSLDHGDYLYAEFLNKSDAYTYSIFIGGHDVWHPNLLECLVTHADADPNSSVVFTDAYKLDKDDNIQDKYQGIMHVSDIPIALRPHYVLTGLTYNLVIYGLSRETKRKLVPLRQRCSGIDHFMVAEISLHGSLVYAPGSKVYLRDISTHESAHDTYVKKHLPKHYQDNPILDFAMQLEWATYLIEKATSMDPFYQQDPIKNLLKSSLISAYICRYWHNLLGFNRGFETFFNHEKVRQLMGLATQGNSVFSDFMNETNAANALTPLVPASGPPKL